MMECITCKNFRLLDDPEPWAFGVCDMYDMTLSETQSGEWRACCIEKSKV